jgi:hypothetical protein
MMSKGASSADLDVESKTLSRHANIPIFNSAEREKQARVFCTTRVASGRGPVFSVEWLHPEEEEEVLATASSGTASSHFQAKSSADSTSWQKMSLATTSLNSVISVRAHASSCPDTSLLASTSKSLSLSEQL